MSGVGKYDHLSHEALVKLLERRDSERRYGLVWEREGIEPDRALNDDFVALDLDVGLSTPPGADGGWRNLVIEGDNWDALRALRLAYAGRIRCILIDPPYPTFPRWPAHRAV
jgi:adenine-specific DNA-methyltransferase